MVNFPNLTSDCDSPSPNLLDLFISSDSGICSTVIFPPSGITDHIVVSVSTDFPLNIKGDAPFHRTTYTYSRVDWGSLHDHLRDVP